MAKKSYTQESLSDSRRRWLLASLAPACLGFAGLSFAQAAESTLPAGTIRVTLLGTGTPEPSPDRFSAATLVEAGGMKFLLDAGRGSSIRLRQIKVSLGSLDAVLLTHFHSDHVVGLPDIWLMGFINPFFGGRKAPLKVIGPQGAKRLVDHMEQAFQDDVKIRIADQKVNPVETKLDTEEFVKDGLVFDKGGVRITAFAVEHGDLIKPSFGYRIDHEGRSVLISGDTKYDLNLIKYAQGVDLIIHEVAEAPEGIKSLPWVKDILAHHTTAEECGRVFSMVRPKLAAYTHLVLLQAPQFPPVTAEEIVEKTRKTYSGPLVVGEDLTRFVIGDDVKVLRWNPVRNSYAV